MKKIFKKLNSDGFTILEVLVGLVIFTIGLLTLLSMIADLNQNHLEQLGFLIKHDSYNYHIVQLSSTKIKYDRP